MKLLLQKGFQLNIINNRFHNKFLDKNHLLYIRWIFITLVFPALFLASTKKLNSFYFISFMFLCIIYNLIISLYFLHKIKNRERVSYLFIFLDIVFLSIFNFILDGQNSIAFMLFILTIGYYGINTYSYNIVRLTIFSVILYSFSCFLSNSSLNIVLITRLLINLFFIFFTALGVSLLEREVKRYNELHKKEFKLARTDKLTGLANRHYFEQKLFEEAKYADLSGKPLNVLIFDLDNFKKFNDAYGHMAGDKLLMLFSDIIRDNISKSDIPVRYGGEEFLILIRDQDINAAKLVGERIRGQLESQRIYTVSGENKKRVTSSCGIAQYPIHSKNIMEIIDYADKALYCAKGKGKNMVICYDEVN
jgi:diguanylate cyclase (GGDEF)-like protein